VKWDDVSKTVSEGIGYGMLLAASWEDQATFDGLWQYYQDHKNTNGLMSWKGSCSGSDEPGAATDADLDAAMALIMADCAWPGAGYGDSATALINAVKTAVMKDDSGRTFLCAGDMWGGDCCGNASYQTPGYLRAFGMHTGDTTFWDTSANDTYFYLETYSNDTTGLVSDWMDPTSLQCNAKSAGDWYGWDACRVPWRVLVDYIWWGTEEAATYDIKIANFVEGKGGVGSTTQGYKLDGSGGSGTPVTAFAGAFAASGIAKDQTTADTFFEALKSVPNDGYFNEILYTLYMTTAVKRFRPGCY
jgi:endo-1,4-beta-D-glucanase Y